jgi:lipopolysaccharide transport system ATP-binding protein
LLPSRLGSRGGPPQGSVREVWALRDVTFKAAAGTILGVVGGNGAGKSTLLKVLARVTAPTGGQVQLRGRVVPLIELGGAFQPHATGRDNVYLNAALYGIDRRVVARRLADIVDFAGIGEFIDAPVRTYSSGMVVRLAFSLAVNLEPNILLADEVLAVGDMAFQQQCLRRIELGTEEDGLTVLFVSHDMDAVRRLCKRVLWLESGRVKMLGPTEEVVKAFEEASWAAVAAHQRRPGANVNDYGAILSTCLVGADGSERAEVSVSEEVTVRVAIRIDEPGIGFRCVLVFSCQGVDAFRSVQPSVEYVAKPGVYHAAVRIPADLLGDNVYTVKTGVWIARDRQERQEDALVQPAALTVRVHEADGRESARGDYRGSLQGVVRPRLAWSVDARDEPISLRVVS